MRPTDINIRCFHCGSRRMTVRAGHMRPVDDPVHCRDCETYLGRRSDLAFERRRLITGAANEPFDVQPDAVALHVPVTLTVIQAEETPTVQTPRSARTPSMADQGA